MTSFDASQLTQFIGTDRYYRLHRRCLLTDGTKFLADAAGAYWLMDATSSHLMELGTADWFVLVRLQVDGCEAVLRYEDGNGKVRAEQQIPFTDFPMSECVFYACWDAEHWVLMLPSEY